eukprot:2688676-Lingulodinium_polyedra.AAC.1
MARLGPRGQPGTSWARARGALRRTTTARPAAPHVGIFPAGRSKWADRAGWLGHTLGVSTGPPNN